VTHPLDDAYVRLDRAMEHLSELKTAAETFIDSEYETAESSAQVDFEPGNQVKITRPESPIPAKIRILISEILFHLRSSLDYLVYQLAILDSNVVQSGTQFLITDSKEQFEGQTKSRLKGINDIHVAAIECLQPYKGANWIRLLRTLSNPDKHRHLTVQTHETRVQVGSGNDATHVFKPVGVKGLFVDYTVAPRGHNPMYMQFHFVFFIAFDYGIPVINTLEQIQTEVANTLASFKPEFEGM